MRNKVYAVSSTEAKAELQMRRGEQDLTAAKKLFPRLDLRWRYRRRVCGGRGMATASDSVALCVSVWLSRRRQLSASGNADASGREMRRLA